MWQLVTPMVLLVLVSLWFAFRRSTENPAGRGGVVIERTVPAGDDGGRGLVVEPDDLMALPLMLVRGWTTPFSSNWHCAGMAVILVWSGVPSDAH